LLHLGRHAQELAHERAQRPKGSSSLTDRGKVGKANNHQLYRLRHHRSCSEGTVGMMEWVYGNTAHSAALRIS
jgi:hypothetical protein